jgi:nicotinamidase/pyrazinamidase
MARRIILWEVDAQADFMLPGGKLYVPGAEKIIPAIHQLVSAAAQNGVFVIASADAHSENDAEFELFPEHCVRGTPGARIVREGLIENFRSVPNDRLLTLPADILDAPQVVLEKQSFDVFDNCRATELVERLGADADYIVFGVVTEICVRCAAKGLLQRGRKVSIVTDAIETLDATNGRSVLDELKGLGALLISTDEALAEIRGAGRQQGDAFARMRT